MTKNNNILIYILIQTLHIDTKHINIENKMCHYVGLKRKYLYFNKTNIRKKIIFCFIHWF